MDSFEIVFQSSVHKDLRRLPKSAIARVMARIEGLAADPLPPRVVKLSDAERLYRIRVGDYRVVYELDTEAKRVTIHYVRHRRDVYRAI
jgi:mRNA interferase RelE/StbE